MLGSDVDRYSMLKLILLWNGQIELHETACMYNRQTSRQVGR